MEKINTENPEENIMEMIKSNYIEKYIIPIFNKDCNKIFGDIYTYFKDLIPFVPRTAIILLYKNIINSLRKKFKNCDNEKEIFRQLNLMKLFNNIYKKIISNSESMAGGNRIYIREIIKNMYKGSNTSYVFLMSLINKKNNIPMITCEQYIISQKINSLIF